MNTQDKSGAQAHTLKRRKAHHKALETLALRVGCKTNGLTLWRKLRRIESELYRVCLNYTNGTNGMNEASWGEAKQVARNRLLNVFGGRIPDGVYINGDPRGHMLKLDSGSAGEMGVTIPEGMARDWGDDGILAPEID